MAKITAHRSVTAITLTLDMREAVALTRLLGQLSINDSKHIYKLTPEQAKDVEGLWNTLHTIAELRGVEPK